MSAGAAHRDDDQAAGPLLLFGGTFDPPHRAHVELAGAAAEQLRASRIVFIPAARNPLKLEDPAASDRDRLAMLDLAVAGLPGAEVCAVEIERGGPSYFVDTLHAMSAEITASGGARFLIGVDQALHFRRWKDGPDILQCATPAVMLRPPWDRPSFEKALRDHFEPGEAERWLAWTLDLPLMDINATEVRRRLQAREPLGGMLDPGVEAYVRERGLYGAVAL